MAKCTICKKEIVLVPSAAERAKKYGGKASDYTSMFTAHAECYVKQRSDTSVELLRKIVKESEEQRVQFKI